MPKLAAFPKAWMQGLCVDGSLPLERWIGMAGELDIDGLEFYSGFLDLREPPAGGRGGLPCRFLSGQRRPELTREEGIRLAAESIEACLPHAAAAGITLVIENHYKDDFWQYPEFAQKMDVFCDLVERVDSPRFGVNYDPSNTILAGEDPLELLRRGRHRVVSMHGPHRDRRGGRHKDPRRG